MKALPILKDLHIRITSKCNLNCPHCYASDWFKDEVKITFEDIKSVILQAIDLGCRKVTFTGGEPLVSIFLEESCRFCFEKNLRIEIETNGILLENLITNLGDLVSKIEFSVSYDGEKMRNKDLSPKVKQNIEKLVKLGCNVKIQTVLTMINIKEFESIFDFSKNLGIKNRVFLAHSPSGNGRNLKLLELNKWLKLLKKLKNKYDHVIVELPDVFSGGTQKKCGWGVHRCEIMPNGDVTSCGPIIFDKRNFRAGNIKKEKLLNIWGSTHFNNIRKIKQSDFESLCAKCKFWRSCLGACRSISSSIGKKLLSPHPFCVSVFNLIKNNKADRSLIPNADVVYSWVNDIQNAKISPYDELYETLVKEQHELV